MCGIAGLCVDPSSSLHTLSETAALMASRISHRGPDSSGSFVSHQLHASLAHQRLAVVELSTAGHQPMRSPNGRYYIAFNGEIYNHMQLRKDLSNLGHSVSWQGHSDTETLLGAIEFWGLDIALSKCVGMWAFALLDTQEQILYLVRDRFGEKPLYWGFSGYGTDRAFLFGSELSALRAFPSFSSPIDQGVLSLYLRFGYVPAPYSIYEGIYKLLPGHLLSIPLPINHAAETPTSRPWWSFEQHIDTSIALPYSSDSQAINDLESSLVRSVTEQSQADVPIGTFLSGGIDSSLITALLQFHTSSKLTTHTIGFENQSYNEAGYAKRIAHYLGTDHHETFCSPTDIQSLIPYLPSIYSEPFADSSQLPTLLVSRSARESGITVALSGDGGDELFCGYNRYFWSSRIWNRVSFIPHSVRSPLGSVLSKISPTFLDYIGSPLPVSQFGQKVHKMATRLKHVRTTDELYSSLVTEWNDTSSLLQSPITHSFPTRLDDALPPSLDHDSVSRMMAKDTLTYLPDDILVKVDRASMSCGLETRSPFLDHRVSDIAWRMPLSMKTSGLRGKMPLVKILSKYVPHEYFDRPKAGFAIPIGDWLRGPLHSWAEYHLQSHRIESEGYLNPEPIAQLWAQHSSGKHDHTVKLWTILMWQSWLEHWG